MLAQLKKKRSRLFQLYVEKSVSLQTHSSHDIYNAHCATELPSTQTFAKFLSPRSKISLTFRNRKNLILKSMMAQEVHL